MEGIRDLIEELRQQEEYFPRRKVVRDETWIQSIDGAKLLAKVYKRLYRVEYQKTRHSVALVDWLIQHEPEQLSEILELLKSIVITSSRPAD